MGTLLLLLGARPRVTEAQDESSKPIPKVLYGADDRQEVWERRGKEYNLAIQSLVALIEPRQLDKSARGFAPAPELTAQQVLGLCEDEAFADQPAVASCSGVLVGEDVVLTAGHCFEDSDTCDRYVYVFDYLYARSDQPRLITDLETYGCKKILSRRREPGRIDFSFVQLDRPVDTRRVPLKPIVSAPAVGDTVTLMGFPSGLPAKVESGGTVRSVPDFNGFWAASLDSFGGNSGGPVFNTELDLIGLLVRGRPDYAHDPERGCMRARQLDEDQGDSGEFEQVGRLDVALSLFCASPDGQGTSPCEPRAPIAGQFGCQTGPDARGYPGLWWWALSLCGFMGRRAHRTRVASSC